MVRIALLAALLLLDSAAFGIDVSKDLPDACAQPTGLLCELLSHPERTKILDPRPDFGWICGSGQTAFQQAAYQIIVEKATRQPGETVWDSGRVDSDKSLSVEYSGQPLRPGESYQWKVRAWNQQGKESGWSEPQGFQMAASLSETKTSLYPLVMVPQPPVKVSRGSGGVQLVDFGKDAFGYLRLQIPPSSETRTLEVRFGEKLRRGRIDRSPGGSIRYYSVPVLVPAGTTEVTVRPSRNERNTNGDAVNILRNVGVVAPFRYIEIAGLAKRLSKNEVTRIAIQYPFNKGNSHFESSNSTLNAVWEICKYSIEATTFCGVYVDGDRERIPYEADAYINQLSHYGVDREFALARHSHEYLLEKPTWPTEWKQHSILMAWADYLYTGDSESLRNNYQVLKDEKLLQAAELEDGLLDTSAKVYRDIVDWPEAERDGFEMCPVNSVVNAFHYATLTRMASIAQVLGYSADEELFAAKAAKFKRQFNDSLWNEPSRRYVDGVGSKHSSLHANLFPLAFDLVPNDRVADVRKFLQTRGMRCSVYAAQYLLEGLYAHDCSRYALDLLASREQRSWFNMIRSGSTITLEAWDIEFKPNLDWNHAWGAAPANIIPSYLVGVRPTEAGFRQFVIQPRPGDLKYFNARVPTIRGPVDVNYFRTDDDCELNVTVPGNCLAKVGLPLAGGSTPTRVLWNGRETQVQLRGQHAWIEQVGPGDHSFRLLTNSRIDQALAPAASAQ